MLVSVFSDLGSRLKTCRLSVIGVLTPYTAVYLHGNERTSGFRSPPSWTVFAIDRIREEL